MTYRAWLLSLVCTMLMPWPLAPARASGSQWEHDETEAGIALYTREVQEHSYDVVKGVVTLDARPETLLALLRDIERYPSWYHGCKQVRVLERPAAVTPVVLTKRGRFVSQTVDESYQLFFLQDAPSIADRFAVLTNRVRVAKDGSLVIAFDSLDKHRYRAPSDAVRMRIRGQWVLSPLSRERTRVALSLNIDPDTSMPAFLVDPKIHAIVFETLRNLRRLAAQPRSIELGKAALKQPH